MSLIDYIVSLDISLFVYLNSLGSESFDMFWNTITYKYTWIPLYLFLLYLIYKYSDAKTLLLYLVLVVVTVTLVDQTTTHLFKNFFERLRPSHNADIADLIRITGRKGGKFGFISAHASNTFAIATLVGYFLKDIFSRARMYLLIWASVVSYSRIYVGVHYPLDIICGALWGILLASLLILLLKKTNLIHKFRLGR